MITFTHVRREVKEKTETFVPASFVPLSVFNYNFREVKWPDSFHFSFPPTLVVEQSRDFNKFAEVGQNPALDFARFTCFADPYFWSVSGRAARRAFLPLRPFKESAPTAGTSCRGRENRFRKYILLFALNAIPLYIKTNICVECLERAIVSWTLWSEAS